MIIKASLVFQCRRQSGRRERERKGRRVAGGARALSLDRRLLFPCSANMLETAPENAKRFAPPPPRNRSLNRRKSGDRYDKPNYSQASEGERNYASYPRNFTAVERGEIPVSNTANENTRSKLIPLEGCSSTEAVQFLAERWAAAVHLLDDPSTDVHEKPVVYSGASGSSWVNFKLPQQTDFLGELQRKIQRTNTTSP